FLLFDLQLAFRRRGSGSRHFLAPYPHQNSFPFSIWKCSTMEPNESAGKYEIAPTVTIVETSRITNSVPFVGKVPLVTGTNFFAARLPAIARAGMMNRNLPTSMSRPMVRLYQGVLALIPAKALPLLPAPLEYVYRISEKTCGPPLFKFAVVGPGGFQ